jgi:hypothetical protein
MLLDGIKKMLAKSIDNVSTFYQSAFKKALVFFVLFLMLVITSTTSNADPIVIEVKNSTKEQITIKEIVVRTYETHKRYYVGDKIVKIAPGDTHPLKTNKELQQYERGGQKGVAMLYEMRDEKGELICRQGFFIASGNEKYSLIHLTNWAGQEIFQHKPIILQSRAFGTPGPRTALIASTDLAAAYSATGNIVSTKWKAGNQFSGLAKIDIITTSE